MAAGVPSKADDEEEAPVEVEAGEGGAVLVGVAELLIVLASRWLGESPMPLLTLRRAAEMTAEGWEEDGKGRVVPLSPLW